LQGNKKEGGGRGSDGHDGFEGGVEIGAKKRKNFWGWGNSFHMGGKREKLRIRLQRTVKSLVANTAEGCFLENSMGGENILEAKKRRKGKKRGGKPNPLKHGNVGGGPVFKHLKSKKKVKWKQKQSLKKKNRGKIKNFFWKREMDV